MSAETFGVGVSAVILIRSVNGMNAAVTKDG